MSRGTIYIADDDAAVREGLSLLMAVSGFATEAFPSGEALLARSPGGPGCIILDMRMAGMNGQEVLDRLAAQGNTLPVLFISAYGDVPTTVRAMRSGAQDFLTKPVDGARLVARVEELVATSLASETAAARRSDLAHQLAQLTPREREVLIAFAAGLDIRATAAKLGISPRTVEVHRSNIVGKTGTNNLAELYRQTVKAGIPID